MNMEEELAASRERVKELEHKAGQAHRRRLPDVRHSVTHKFSVADYEGYLIVGLFEDGTPGEMFVTMAKEGSTIGGLMDTVARMASMMLQYGISVDVLADKFIGSRFEPMGYTHNPRITPASSLPDYIFRWLKMEFGSQAQAENRRQLSCVEQSVAVPIPASTAVVETVGGS